MVEETTKHLRDSAKSELKGVCASFEWLVTEKMQQLDYMIRRMYEEARIFGVSPEKASPYIEERLREWSEKVIKKAEVDEIERRTIRSIRDSKGARRR